MSQRRARVPGPGDSKAVKVPSRAHVAVSIKPQVPVAAVCRQCGPKERTNPRSHPVTLCGDIGHSLSVRGREMGIAGPI